MRNAAQKAARLKYEQSEKGKEAKRRHEAAYIASGGRALAEQRRSEQPVSEARKAARRKWASSEQGRAYHRADRAKRRSLEAELPLFDTFVLEEAVRLAKLREVSIGGKWEIDHIIPIANNGSSRAENIQVVPRTWNRRKYIKHTNRFLGA